MLGKSMRKRTLLTGVTVAHNKKKAAKNYCSVLQSGYGLFRKLDNIVHHQD